MRLLCFFVFLSSFVLISCDGKERVYKTNQEVLKEHNLYNAFSGNIVYTPTTYLETSTDTILSNGFNVNIKLFTDMEHSFLNETLKDSTSHKNYFRDIKTLITITKNNHKIVSKLITKKDFTNYSKALEINLKNKIIQGAYVNQYASILNNKVLVNVLFLDPASNEYENYLLSFDKKGSVLIEKELNQNYI